MSKTLNHHKKKHNKTKRLRKGGKLRKSYKGGRHEFNLAQLKRNMKDGHHLFAVHSSDACGHCRQFKHEWEKIMERLPYNPKLTVARLGPDATDYMNNQYYRKHNYSVDAVPTIVYYIVNKEAPREYEGERDADKILKWFQELIKTAKENDLEITVKPKTEVIDRSVSFEEPDKFLEDQQFAEQEPEPEPEPELEPEQPQELEQRELLEEPEPKETERLEPEQQQVDKAANAFPSSPLSPASITETVSTKANELNEQLKSATESATNAVSDVGTRIANMFSSTKPEETPKQAQTPTTRPNVPQVPSLIGGIRRRKMTQRKHRKSKSTKKSRKSKK